MTVKISCPSNKSGALVRHMGNLALQRKPWQSRKSPAVALSRHFDMVLRVDATSFQFAILKVSTVLSSAELYG